MTSCIKCGSDLKPNAKFCSDCGEKVGLNCLNCGVSLPSDATFCGECGTKVAIVPQSNSVSIKFSEPNKNFAPIDINIETATATGPSRDNEYSVSVKFRVTNKSEIKLSLFNITTQIFNSFGQIVEQTTNTYEEEVEPENSHEFETYIGSFKTGLLGESPGASTIVVSVVASKAEIINLGEVKVPSKAYQILPISNLNSKEIYVSTGSVWKAPGWEDGDPSIEAMLFVQNLTTKYYPQIKLSMKVFDKVGRELDTGSNYEELLPGGTAGISLSNCRVEEKKSIGSTAHLDINVLTPIATGIGQMSGISIESSEEDSSEVDFGGKRIYIKTEPGGKVVFGKLDESDAKLLEKAARSKEMNEDLLDLRYNSSGNFRECSGVVNSGEEGDAGNEGDIVIDAEGPIEIPTDERGNYEDGAYLVYLSLSKVSIEFTFEPTDGSFDRDKFAEVSVPINLPEFIEHQTYGRPDFNVVTDYLYDGESIEEYDRDLVDRGYDDLISFFVVKNGKSKLIYKSHNGEETWH